MLTVTVADVRQRSNVTYERESHLETASEPLMNESGRNIVQYLCVFREKKLEECDKVPGSKRYMHTFNKLLHLYFLQQNV